MFCFFIDLEMFFVWIKEKLFGGLYFGLLCFWCFYMFWGIDEFKEKCNMFEDEKMFFINVVILNECICCMFGDFELLKF